TDLVIDPFNSNRLLIGLGNIGLVTPANATAGLWLSTSQGGSWNQMIHDTTSAIPNNSLPSGVNVGRVTIGIGSGRVGDERYIYVLIASPPVSVANVNYGMTTVAPGGLYRTK